MKALMVKGFRTNVVDVDGTQRVFEYAVDGKIETIKLRDNGVLICDRDAQEKNKSYNNLASIIAGTCVYGAALIVGRDGERFEDAPAPFLVLLNYTEGCGGT